MDAQKVDDRTRVIRSADRAALGGMTMAMAERDTDSNVGDSFDPSSSTLAVSIPQVFEGSVLNSVMEGGAGGQQSIIGSGCVTYTCCAACPDRLSNTSSLRTRTTVVCMEVSPNTLPNFLATPMIDMVLSWAVQTPEVEVRQEGPLWFL